MSVIVMEMVWQADLPPNEKLVLLAYADHADHTGLDIYPSVDLISKKTGYSTRHVQRITRMLENQGLLVLDGHGPKGTNKWKIPAQDVAQGGDSHVSPGNDTHVTQGMTPLSPEPSFKPSLKIVEEVANPNIFTLYENNIGFISAMMADQLMDAEAEYPNDWFAPAIQEAVNNNARSWSYVKAILARWKRDGYMSDKRNKPGRGSSREEVYRAWLAEGE